MPLFNEPRFKPLPNAYTAHKNWTVNEAAETSNIDPVNHVVSAPSHLSDSATLERTRINARAALSHIRAHDSTIPSWMYQMAFEYKSRVEAHKACDGITEAKPYPLPDMKFNISQRKWADVIDAINTQEALCHGGCDDTYAAEYLHSLHEHDYAQKEICHHIATFIRHAAHHMNHRDHVVNMDALDSLHQAHELYKLIDELTDQPPPQIGDEPIDTDSTGNDYASWEEVIERVASWASHYGESDAEWADMHVMTHDMPKRIEGFMGKRRKRRLTDAGSALTRPDRIMTDGLCFDAKGNRRDVVGAILIDNSGSMAFSDSDVEKLVQAAPGVIIAHYSGCGEEGILEIVVQNGRRAERQAMAATHGGNGVDGPALLWLAEQQGPRVWVSDGLVTGRNDCTSISLVHQCLDICNQNDITRVPDIEVLTKWTAQQRSKTRGR